MLGLEPGLALGQAEESESMQNGGVWLGKDTDNPTKAFTSLPATLP